VLIALQKTVRVSQAVAIAVALSPQHGNDGVAVVAGDVPEADGLDVCRIKRCANTPMLNLWQVPICQEHYQQCCDFGGPSIIWLAKRVPDDWRKALPNDEEQERQKEYYIKVKKQIALLPDDEIIAPFLKAQPQLQPDSLKVSVSASTHDATKEPSLNIIAPISKARSFELFDRVIAPTLKVQIQHHHSEPARLVLHIAPTTASRETTASVRKTQRPDGDVVSAIQNLSVVEQKELVQRLNGCDEKRLLHVQITKSR